MAQAITPAVVLRTLCIIWIIVLAILESWPGFGLWLPSEYSVGQQVGREVVLSGRIIKVDASGQSQKLTLDELRIDSIVADDRVLVFAPRYPELAYGQVVTMRCPLRSPEPFNGFRYDRYLAAKHVYATCFVREAPLVVGEAGQPIIKQLLQFRLATLRAIDQLFSEPNAALLSGLLLGADELSDHWQEYFRRTGTSHIVVASGYNVTVVLTWILAGFIAIGLNRRRSFGLVLISLFGYVLMAGAGSPIIRAAILGGSTTVAQQLGRRTEGLHLLLLVGSIMLIFNPLLLLGDIGFQLSMLSTGGLMLFDPLIASRLKWIPAPMIRTALSSTLAATIATLPLTVFTFGSISLVAPIANLLILPLIPWAMLTGLVAVAVAQIVSSFSHLLALIPSMLLDAILTAVKMLANLPFAYVDTN
jgi:competence protein ComEC